MEITFVNLTFVFKSKNINDLTRFSFLLLGGKQQKIKFDDSTQKVHQLGFRTDVLKFLKQGHKQDRFFNIENTLRSSCGTLRATY